MAIAAGKTNASRLQAGDRILVVATTDNPGHALLSHRKTGEGVHVARVTFKEWVPGGRRGTYTIYTTSGISTGHQAIQTMWLAPEDAAGVKRAHVEALALDATYDTYPLADDSEIVECPVQEPHTHQGNTLMLENVDPEVVEEAVRLDQEAILTHDVRPTPAACLHAGCHPGRCVYGPDHGQPAQEAQERLNEAGVARGTLNEYQAAVAELDGAQRASLAGDPAALAVQAMTDRHGRAIIITGGQGVSTTVQTVPMVELMAEVAAEQAAQEVAASLEAPALVVRASESLVQPVVSGPESRVVAGDVVRIHRGTRLYEVLRVEEDLSRDATDPTSQWEKTVMARLVPCDPEDQRDPGWVNTDLLHRVPPVARVTGVLVEAYQELADEVVAVAGPAWDAGRGVLRQPGLISSPGSRPPYAVLIPVGPECSVFHDRPVGCLRIGDAIVINQRCFRVVWDGGPAEPHLEPARWRDR